MAQTVKVVGINANLAPDAFHRWATHFYKCRQDFISPHRFSPVPYFLLCRAIELEIKAKHLKRMTQKQVKKSFGHDLANAYQALEDSEKLLTSSEKRILVEANQIYDGKGFEYFEPEDALTGYSRYPDIIELDAIARKLIGI